MLRVDEDNEHVGWRAMTSEMLFQCQPIRRFDAPCGQPAEPAPNLSEPPGQNRRKKFVAIFSSCPRRPSKPSTPRHFRGPDGHSKPRASQAPATIWVQLPILLEESRASAGVFAGAFEAFYTKPPLPESLSVACCPMVLRVWTWEL